MSKFSDIRAFPAVFAMTMLLLISCVNDVDLSKISNDVKIDQSLVIPVGEVNLTIKDIIAKLGMPTGIDTLNNEIFFQNITTTEYNFRLFSLADSIKPFNIEATPVPVPVTFPAGIEIPFPDISQELDLGINANTEKQRVDIAKMNSSLLNISVNVTPDIAVIPASDISFEFVFPADKLKIDNGQNPVFTPGGYGQNGQISIGSYTIFANGQQKIPYTIKVKVKTQSNPVSLGPTSKVTINMNFADIGFVEAWGRFKISHSDVKTMEFSISDISPNANFLFNNPTIDATATTNIGSDIIIKLDYLKAYNSTKPGISQFLWFDNHTTNSTSLTFNGPVIVGKSDSTSFNQFNDNNGEIGNLFNLNPYPNTLEYKYTVSDNPASTRLLNFVTNESKVKFNLKTRINMSFRDGSNYSFQDTVQNVGQYLSTLPDNLDSAVLVLNISNGIPIKAIARLTFCQSFTANDTIVSSPENKFGSLFKPLELNAPDVNPDGSVKTGGIKAQTMLIGLNKNAIIELKKTKFIVCSVGFAGNKAVINGVQTTNPIHITTANSFNVKVGIFLKPSIDLTLQKAHLIR
ncbi:MAG: hypothetical protein WCL70_04765 [Paludibacter sp.]